MRSGGWASCSTRLRSGPGEYVWGKFAAVLVGALAVLAIHLAAMVFFFHVMPNSEAKEMRGPFQVLNYLRPALIFSLPTIVFLAGASLAVGEWTRRTILVFLLPLASLCSYLFFLWTWSPAGSTRAQPRLMCSTRPASAG